MTALPILSLIAALVSAQNSTPTPARIFERLLPEAEHVLPGPKIEIKLVIDPTVDENAYAFGPEGPDRTYPFYKVVFHQEFFKDLENADELALLLAHEIAHIRLGHADSWSSQAAVDNWWKRMQADRPDEFAKIAKLADPYSYWLGTPEYAKFRQGQESDADKYATDIATRAGFNGEVGADFFRRFAKKYPKMETIRPTSQHPASLKRAEAVSQRTQALNEFLMKHPQGPWDASYEENQP